MQDIKPTVSSPDIMCAETPASPCALALFGASGDLAARKLIPSLAQLFARDLLSDHFCLLGCGRSELSDQAFRQKVLEALGAASEKVPSEVAARFAQKFYYVSGDYSSPDFYQAIQSRLVELDTVHRFERNIVFYLSVPPVLYSMIVDQIRNAGLSCAQAPCAWHAHLVVEKPFGRDLFCVLVYVYQCCRSGLGHSPQRFFGNCGQTAFFVSYRGIVVEFCAERRCIPLPPFDSVQQFLSHLFRHGSTGQQVLRTIQFRRFGEDRRASAGYYRVASDANSRVGREPGVAVRATAFGCKDRFTGWNCLAAYVVHLRQQLANLADGCVHRLRCATVILH